MARWGQSGSPDGGHIWGSWGQLGWSRYQMGVDGGSWELYRVVRGPNGSSWGGQPGGPAGDQMWSSQVVARVQSLV